MEPLKILQELSAQLSRTFVLSIDFPTDTRIDAPERLSRETQHLVIVEKLCARKYWTFSFSQLRETSTSPSFYHTIVELSSGMSSR